ncbi:DUF6287 domain-containing protein [Lactococcus lactis]|jgi:hypothetical protein|uniref:DUF6287 domain-containing protein n=2 Tax=Lactococcus lactis TaxID=1358 RepID=A0AAW8UEC2_9LACT|nr:DUF6287 domain-containing protein [Lactococcus lactis]MDT2871179.1 DUF6287 domain-containing protein [Lactococcus lactis]MDT2873447.1 DUF6287 domain-containing protein [Lactococcus lactis]MDT2881242.1 DUF6287 domain-containing protein [Lactococcus lactis]MDT2890035.1 DUF6287 domain-containing protein [Lactococcus lactis]MDT2892550.1 DUF6287 domain-containing protein [Lactococcus lactis]
MEKKFGKIKKYVTVSAIILGALVTLAACSSGSKESEKAEHTSSSQSIKNKESLPSSSSQSSSISTSSSSSSDISPSSTSQYEAANSSQILAGDYSSLNGTWQTTDGGGKAVLKNGTIIFSSGYQRVISGPQSKNGIIMAGAVNLGKYMGFMFAAANSSPTFANSSQTDKTDRTKDRFAITSNDEGMEIFDTNPTSFFYKISNDTTSPNS